MQLWYGVRYLLRRQVSLSSQISPRSWQHKCLKTVIVTVNTAINQCHSILGKCHFIGKISFSTLVVVINIVKALNVSGEKLSGWLAEGRHQNVCHYLTSIFNFYQLFQYYYTDCARFGSSALDAQRLFNPMLQKPTTTTTKRGETVASVDMFLFYAEKWPYKIFHRFTTLVRESCYDSVAYLLELRIFYKAVGK